ncbi:MAG: hypothetical protein TYPL_2400 [Candidatus Tyloplasma litorale]|nr:MAG: hypothetical protein TYPL_2400 [Mycoplasmatales bacterium]
MNTNRIIGKHALILTGRGKTEIASQIFVYDHIREVRVDIEKLEVKVLMNYDEAYFRVYKVEITKELNKEAAVKMVLDFYSKLLNASMKFSKEELENLEKNRKQIIEKTKKNGKQ